MRGPQVLLVVQEDVGAGSEPWDDGRRGLLQATTSASEELLPEPHALGHKLLLPEPHALDGLSARGSEPGPGAGTVLCAIESPAPLPALPRPLAWPGDALASLAGAQGPTSSAAAPAAAEAGSVLAASFSASPRANLEQRVWWRGFPRALEAEYQQSLGRLRKPYDCAGLLVDSVFCCFVLPLAVWRARHTLPHFGAHLVLALLVVLEALAFACVVGVSSTEWYSR